MSSRRSLSILNERRRELETCAFCPKLCRSACPVSEAEGVETLTPWGKMSGTHDVASGRVAASADHAALAWACSGCFACRERCEHRNPVVDTLYEARAEHVQAGLAPEGSERVRVGWDRRVDRVRERARELAETGPMTAAVALVIGCEYLLRLPESALDAIRVTHRLFGKPKLLEGCCGHGLDAAGDPAGARRLRRELAGQLGSGMRLLVADAGCAFSLRGLGATALADAAGQAAGRDGLVRAPVESGVLRYHDPCLLGRGLGVYDAPRRLVARACAGGLSEFVHRRAGSRCSGGGGLLPVTRPTAAAAIAKSRTAEHERLGGGTIVTGCAAGTRRLQASGANVVDFFTLARRWMRA